MQALCIDPARVADFWPHVRSWLRAAIERNGLGRFRDFEADLFDGSALLWLAWDGEKIHGCAATRMRVSDRNKACVILAAGGRNIRRWVHLIESIEAYAKLEGCDLMRTYGPRGWQRLLKSYRVDTVILEKAL